jgi:predicted neuraminidase
MKLTFCRRLVGLVAASAILVTRAADPAIVKSEFIVENPPFPSSHASTIVETPDGLLAAWFGGTRERATDVSIWLARNDGSGWSLPEEVANGVDIKRGRRYPCWNPVLFRRINGDLLLFYKVGPSPEKWWGMVRLSDDNGRTWSKVDRLPKGHVGPVRNKPVEFPGGTILCGSSSEDKGWRVHLEWSKNPLGIWERGPTLNSAQTFAAIQPTILVHGDYEYQLLCRSKQGWVTELWTTNAGLTWLPMMRTRLPNPNSAIDAVKLRDGRSLLVYNHSRDSRGVLNVAVSDDGKKWQMGPILENESGSEFSYPAVIETADGLVHVTYTWKRQRIKHVVLDPAKMTLRDLPAAGF